MKITGLDAHSHLRTNTQANRESCKSLNTYSHTYTLKGYSCLDTYLFPFFFLTHSPRHGLTSKAALTKMHKGTGSDTFSALEVRQAESVIISVEYSDFCIKPSHNNLDLLV